MLTKPLITIVTPSYNQGKFIEETIVSVIEQGYQNLEYIIIDGGSTDNTLEIVKKYQNKITYWVSERDSGQSDAINKGFLRSRGAILGWLNSDDYLLPGSLEKVSAHFSLHPDVGCIIGDLLVVGERGSRLLIKKAVPYHFATELFTTSLVPQPSTFFTRAAWEMTGPLDTELHYQMDHEFFLRMGKKGIKFGLLKEPLAAFRYHRQSKTVSEFAFKGKVEKREVQSRFYSEVIRAIPYKEYALVILEWLFKARMFFMRGLTRGDFIPLKGTRARRQS